MLMQENKLQMHSTSMRCYKRFNFSDFTMVVREHKPNLSVVGVVVGGIVSIGKSNTSWRFNVDDACIQGPCVRVVVQLKQAKITAGHRGD
jgi:hypothetical protein